MELYQVDEEMTLPRIEWTNCTVKLGDLKPWSLNPRFSTKAQAQRIIDSLKKYGQPLTIAISPGNDVYDGHQRLSAWLTVHGSDFEVDARRSSRPLTDEERRGMAIALSPLGAFGSFDWDKLSGWDSAELKEWGADSETLKGWKSDVSALSAFVESEKPEPAPEADIDRAEELREKWGVVTGQLWIIPSKAGGEHRLICGDCTDRAVVERVMGGEKARLEFSDPPYEFDTDGGGILAGSRHMEEIKNAEINFFDPSLIILIAETSVFCCNKVLVPEYIKLAQANKTAWDLCFYKKENTPPNFGGHLMTDTEYLPVLGKQSPNSGMEKDIYSKAYIGGLDDGHEVSWQKPVGLVCKFVRLFSDVGNLVIDRFVCTGTTIVACEQLSRQCRAIEISPAYVAVALERLSQMGLEPKLSDN